MSAQKRIYFRPDPDLERQEAIDQTVNAFVEFFIEQAEARGDHAAAERLRAKLAERSPAAPALKARRKPPKPAGSVR